MNPWGGIQRSALAAMQTFLCARHGNAADPYSGTVPPISSPHLSAGQRFQHAVFGCRVRRGGYLPDGVKLPLFHAGSAGWQHQGAGPGWHDAFRSCNTAQKESLAGLEFAFGIPGTVGGAVYMNAGAYGGEIKDVLTAVTFLDENLHLQTLPVQELQLGYRTSIFERCSWCILEAEFTLHPGDAQEIHTAMQEHMRRRKENSRWNTRPPAVPSSALWASLPAS